MRKTSILAAVCVALFLLASARTAHAESAKLFFAPSLEYAYAPHADKRHEVSVVPALEMTVPVAGRGIPTWDMHSRLGLGSSVGEWRFALHAEFGILYRFTRRVGLGVDMLHHVAFPYRDETGGAWSIGAAVGPTFMVDPRLELGLPLHCVHDVQHAAYQCGFSLAFSVGDHRHAGH